MFIPQATWIIQGVTELRNFAVPCFFQKSSECIGEKSGKNVTPVPLSTNMSLSLFTDLVLDSSRIHEDG